MDMTFTQLQDIFAHIQQVHRRVIECCSQVGDATDNRSKLLVDFFRQWGDRLARCFASVEQESAAELLETRVQYGGTEKVDDALDEVCDAANQDADLLIQKALELQGEIINLLEQLAERGGTPETREALASLAEFEHKAAKELSTAIVTQRDM